MHLDDVVRLWSPTASSESNLIFEREYKSDIRRKKIYDVNSLVFLLKNYSLKFIRRFLSFIKYIDLTYYDILKFKLNDSNVGIYFNSGSIDNKNFLIGIYFFIIE